MKNKQEKIDFNCSLTAKNISLLVKEIDEKIKSFTDNSESKEILELNRSSISKELKEKLIKELSDKSQILPDIKRLSMSLSGEIHIDTVPVKKTDSECLLTGLDVKNKLKVLIRDIKINSLSLSDSFLKNKEMDEIEKSNLSKESKEKYIKNLSTDKTSTRKLNHSWIKRLSRDITAVLTKVVPADKSVLPETVPTKNNGGLN